MIQFKYIITDPQGIHARPAGELVKISKNFTSTILIENEGKQADCKKIFALMSLGVKNGSEITVTIEGEDETMASVAIKNYLVENM